MTIISKVNITNNMFMYCNKVYKRDYDQRFSLNEPVLPLTELCAKCAFIFLNVYLIFNLNILLSVAKMFGIE